LISFENWTHGFLVTIAGQRLLWHTTNRPAVFIHRVGEIPSAWRGAGALRSTMASVEGACCAFAAGITMRESLVPHSGGSAIYSLRFSALDPQIDALRLVLHDNRGARWNGLGPRHTHRVRGKLAISSEEDAVAFSLDGRFLHCVSEGAKAFNFTRARIVIDLKLPATIELGYASSTEAACELWHIRREGRLTVENVPELPQRDLMALKRGSSVTGRLAALSFSGADPILYQRLNREFVLGAHGELGWKIDDMLLCQPDIVLPPEYRRELPVVDEPGMHGARVRNRYTKIRAGLVQYWDACERRWRVKGLPAIAHPSIMSECGVSFDDTEDMLFSGPDLIFAPNLKQRGDVCQLTLPSGEWVHLWTSRLYYGGKTTVYAPKGTPALFYRSESEYAWLFDSIRQMASRL